MNQKAPSLRDAEARFSGKYAATVKQTLWIAYKPYLKTALGCLFMGLWGRFILLANANVIGFWVDSFCQEGVDSHCRGTPQIFQGFGSKEYLILLGTMSALGFVSVLAFRIIFSRLSAQAISQIYDETTFRISRQPMSFFDSTPAGRIITRFSSDYGNVFRLFGGPLAELICIVFDLVSMIVLITFASPIYLPVVFLIAGMDYVIYRMNREKLRQSRRNLSASRSPSIAHFAETAQGANTIRSFIKQRPFARRFQVLDQDYLTHKINTVRDILTFSFQINCMTACFLLVTGLLAWWLLIHGQLSIGSIGVAFGFIALSGNTVQMFFEWITQFEEAIVGVERLDQYIRKPLEIGAKLPSKAQFQTGHSQYSETEEKKRSEENIPTAKASEVSFENVWFQYRSDLPPILKGLTFKIHAGERFGIVGRTGSGKSSLIQALFSLYPLTEGKIQIDGADPSNMDLKTFRHQISFIAQDPTLFSGTLRDNLDVESHRAEQDIFAALQRVGLKDWASFEGLRKSVEEKGRNLSLGERQLICMARCLLQNSPIVVMDEATSSVDPHSEEILVRATDEFFTGKTQIIIAHRLSTLRNCDRILWLHNGTVQMLGSPAEVLPVFQKTSLSQTPRPESL